MRSGAFGVFAILALVGSTGCPLEKRCTLIYVPESLTITFSRPIVGPYTAGVRTGGFTYECGPLPDGGTGPVDGGSSGFGGGCRPNGISIIGPQHPLGDAFTIVMAAEGRVFRATLNPKTVTSEPNGDGCGEVKEQTATLNVD